LACGKEQHHGAALFHADILAKENIYYYKVKAVQILDKKIYRSAFSANRTVKLK